MRVTVIIPAFDAQAYLGEALNSVIAQGLEDLEIIVVDDGSTDGTGEVASATGDSRVRYVRQSRMGTAAARNHGVALASGHLIAFLDADDVWLANKLAVQIESLERGDGDMIFAHVEEFISPDCRQDLEGVVRVRPKVAGLCADTLVIRRSDFERVGGFDPACQIGEFIDWYARAIEAGLRPATLPDIFVRRRLHTANMTRFHRNDSKHYALTMKKILDRRRTKP
jgi:glycosyltransferase involved in cell wall biosynthesis